MILTMNKLFSASDKIIIFLRSQNIWYIIIISTEANMILAMNESSSAFDETITSSENQNV